MTSLAEARRQRLLAARGFASEVRLAHNGGMSFAFTSLPNTSVRAAAVALVRVVATVILSVVVVVVLPDRPAAA